MRVQTISLILVVICCFGCGRSRPKVGTVSGKQVVVGKLLIQSSAGRTAKVRANDDSEIFFADQIMRLSSLELRKTAEEALLKIHSEWEPSEVKLEISRIRGSSVISLVGRGGEVDCARSLIDMMMDVYLNNVQSAQPIEAKSKDESAKVEKELVEAERLWNCFKLDNDMAHTTSSLASLQRRLRQFTSASTFYQREMESSSRLSLEQDIERRRMSSALPPDMPAEFAVIAKVSPTANELAYLTSIKQSNALATEAARKEATKDREGRIDSHRRQAEILDDLMKGIQTEMQKLGALQEQAQKIEQAYKTAESAYKISKESEKKDGLPAFHPSSPGIVASVVERASVATDGN